MNEIVFFPPDKSLSPFIYGYLYSRHRINGIEKPFFTPKGSAAIVILLEINSSSYLEYPDPSSKIYFDRFVPYLCGQMSRMGKSHIEGQFDVFVIVFNPTGLFHFMEGSPRQITDRFERMEHFGLNGLSQKLKNLFESNAKPENCISDVNKILIAHFSSCIRKNVTLNMAPIVNEMLQRNGLIGLAEIVERLEVSFRTFQNHFKNQIGLSPKLFCRIIRFNALLLALDENPMPDILELALQFGYSDNSHLHKDFKQFVGMTPKKYLQLYLNINSEIELELKRNFSG
ncbi:MAG: AraC family transcriptional regulator [Mongoliibacter sp.]|uniref:helix-turn-helix domain-containing protein n=1 Tax=Mongoliibacter sp. TaxID=2022438 RepID=UPI0012F1714F|nr:helix-turn-helix domain-containing protein [Mongoliibacter sp.]TVP49639.1 MAG: AraC family transcriptional regulator [Mongoliibacter sp.]